MICQPLVGDKMYTHRCTFCHLDNKMCRGDKTSHNTPLSPVMMTTYFAIPPSSRFAIRSQHASVSPEQNCEFHHHHHHYRNICAAGSECLLRQVTHHHPKEQMDKKTVEMSSTVQAWHSKMRYET